VDRLEWDVGDEWFELSGVLGGVPGRLDLPWIIFGPYEVLPALSTGVRVPFLLGDDSTEDGGERMDSDGWLGPRKKARAARPEAACTVNPS
jgi:hypothetical protein